MRPIQIDQVDLFDEEVATNQLSKRSKQSKSKKRKFASQPRGATKKANRIGAHHLPMMELPMQRIKEATG